MDISRSKATRGFVASLAGLALTACTSDRLALEDASVSDSPPVQESPSLPGNPSASTDGSTSGDGSRSELVIRMSPAQIEDEPFLTVGEVGAGAGSPRPLFGVVTPFLLPTGRLVVPETSTFSIHVFGPDGAYLETLGREGEGPGEFRDLSAAWPRGDAIEAHDFRTGRVTRFLPNGSTEVIRLQQESAAFPVPGALPDGWLLVRILGPAESGRDRTAFVSFAGDGSAFGQIAEVEGMHRFFTPEFSGPDPLSPAARFAVSGGNIYIGETMTPAILVFDPGGELRSEIVWEPETGVSANQAFRAVVDSAVARAGPDRAEATRQRLEAFPVRDGVPAYWTFQPDTEGFVWVQPFEPGRHSLSLGMAVGTGGRWLVFSPDGVPAGSVTVPEGLQITQITADAVVGIFQDEFGVESVRAYRLRRNGI